MKIIKKPIKKRIATANEIANDIKLIAKGTKNSYCSFSRRFFCDRAGVEYKVVVERQGE